MAAYSRWLSCQASSGGAGAAFAGVEQKVTALSRRTAAEFRRAEKERGELGRRLEALEQLLRQQLGSLDVRLGQCREEALEEAERAAQRVRGRFEREVQQLSEALCQQRGEEMRGSEDRNSEVLRTLVKRAEADHAGLEELRAWRREAEQRLAACAEEAAAAAQGSMASTTSERLASQLEEQLESTITRERKQAHERLRSSCAELTGHLNELRQELVVQQRALETVAERLEARRDHAHRQLAAHVTDLEAQISELGAALAARMQAKLASMMKALGIQGEDQEPREEGGLQRRICALEERAAVLEGLQSQVQLLTKGPLQGEAGQILEDLREEARTVHAEVMSVDTRLAAVEEWMVAMERLSDRSSQQRLNALFHASDRPPSAASSRLRSQPADGAWFG